MSAIVIAHPTRRREAPGDRLRARSGSRGAAPETAAPATWWSTDGSGALAPLGSLPGGAPWRPPESDGAVAPETSDAVAPRAGGTRCRPVGQTREERRARAPVRLTRRGRLAVTVATTALALLLAVSVLPAVVGGMVSAFSVPAPVETSTVIVQPGQSLWDIAATAEPGGNTAQVVARIADANGLTSAAQVRPGRRLVVPVG